MPTGVRWRLALLVGLFALLPSDARAALEDATPDHDAVLFVTTDRLVAADVDQNVNDLYMRSGGELTLISTSPYDRHDSRAAQHGSFAYGADRIAFLTSQRLVPEDTDEDPDSYLWEDGKVSLTADSLPYRDVADRTTAVDRDTYLIGTDEPLIESDTDGVQDIYLVSPGELELISRGSDLPVHLGGAQAISRDGRRLVVTSQDRLGSGDEDSWVDLYMIGGEAPELVSTSVDSRRSIFPVVLGLSPDGSSLAWSTSERATEEDLDGQTDVYVWRGGRNELASASAFEAQNGGSASVTAIPQWVSQDARTVFFTTRSRLTAEDPDAYVDVYRWHDGSLELVSPRDTSGASNADASAGLASADGSTVVFSTSRRLTAADTDQEVDLYRWREGEIALVTAPQPGAPEPSSQGRPAMSFWKLAADGSTTVFQTSEALVPGDRNSVPDLYLWREGELEIASDGGPPNPASGDFSSVRLGVDASVLFDTRRALLGADRNDGFDTYRYADGRLSLVSGGGDISEPEPDTVLISGPPASTNDPNPVFRFKGSREGLRFECRVGTTYWLACADGGDGWTPPEPLNGGRYTFEVRAVGWDRVADSTPATHSFLLDRWIPDVKIEAGPDGVTRERTPAFGFVSYDDDLARFECSIDQGEPEFRPCTSPRHHQSTEPLDDGSYVFRVRVTDEAGNTRTRERSFHVDATGAEVMLLEAPDPIVTVRRRADVSFRFEATDETEPDFVCRLTRRQVRRACGSPAVYRGLRPGEYRFRVRGIDGLGNLGEPVSASFVVRASR